MWGWGGGKDNRWKVWSKQGKLLPEAGGKRKVSRGNFIAKIKSEKLCAEKGTGG